MSGFIDCENGGGRVAVGGRGRSINFEGGFMQTEWRARQKIYSINI